MIKKLFYSVLFMLLISAASGLCYTNVTPEDVYTRLVKGDTLLLLDVREVSEYRAGHIAEPEGRLPLTPALMPWRSNVLKENYQLLPKDRDIIVYCRSGRRSVSASLFLESKGFTGIFNMTGGFKTWAYEKRTGGFGDHSGAWVIPGKPGPVVINCQVEGISSALTFPSAAIPGKDSVYVELHLVSDLLPQPPGAPQSDIRGLYRVSVLDPFGLSLFKGDSLALSDKVKLHLYFEPNPYSMPPWNEGITVFVPDEGWVPVEHTLDNIGFHHSGALLRKWYNLKGTYGRGK